MGCSQPQIWVYSPENEKVLKFEESIGLGRHRSGYYEGLMSRLGKSENFSKALEGFQRFSGIEISGSLEDLLSEYFSTDNQTNLKAFKCFCILLSQSPPLEKGESLWYTFDTTLESFLKSSEIKLMLSYLLTTSIQISISFAQNSSYPDSKSLSTYQSTLKAHIPTLTLKLLSHFTQSKEFVTKEEFLLRLQDRPEGLICSTGEIRAQLELISKISLKLVSKEIIDIKLID